MTEKKSKAATPDLSRFGINKKIKIGDEVKINADRGMGEEIVGLPNGAVAVVTEVKSDGVMFRVEGVGDNKTDRDFLVWANQIA